MISIFNGILGRQRSAKDNELCQVARIDGKYTLVGTGDSVTYAGELLSGSTYARLLRNGQLKQGQLLTYKVGDKVYRGRIFSTDTPLPQKSDILIYTDCYVSGVAPARYLLMLSENEGAWSNKTWSRYNI